MEDEQRLLEESVPRDVPGSYAASPGSRKRHSGLHDAQPAVLLLGVLVLELEDLELLA